MLSWSRRALTRWTIAALIIALATVGGYQLGSSRSSAPAHPRLATGFPNT